MEIVYVGIKSKSGIAQGFGVVVVTALIATLAGCGGDDGDSDAASTTKPSATVSATVESTKPTRQEPKADSPKPAKPEPKKVTMTLAEIADTPGTMAQFKKFVAEHGTAEQKKAVKHLTKWLGYSRKAYPAIEVASDYPVINYEAEGATDEVIALEKETQYVAEAFAAWWQIDEPSVITVMDRGGEYSAGVSCIRADSSEADGSCMDL
ncbi:hypothetical protein [Streptomyces sp. NPDC088816]|uniref:hypothetical protein n=1 Tax=Streptomyces sp. NPDC088816 TaxID=3365906 RepID=UPI003811DE0A